MHESDEVIVIKSCRSVTVKLPKLPSKEPKENHCYMSRRVVIKANTTTMTHVVEAGCGNTINFKVSKVSLSSNKSITLQSAGNTWVTV